MAEIYETRPVTEKELEKKYGVEFSRNPRGERLVLKNSKFLEETYVQYEIYEGVFLAIVWLVDFLRVDNKDLENPRSGLLIIQKKKWVNACLRYTPNDLKGKVEIVVDNKRQIKSVRNDLK